MLFVSVVLFTEALPTSTWIAAHVNVLLQIENWNTFDVFQVANLSKGLPLETVTLALFAQHDLLDKLKIPYDRLQKFVRV